jgi:hypothetical protein
MDACIKQAQFEAHATSQNTEGMWQMLSDIAEELLEAKESQMKRWMMPQAVRKDKPHAKQVEVLSIRRQLLRLARVARRANDYPDDFEARESLERKAKLVAKEYVELKDVEWYSEPTLELLDEIIEGRKSEERAQKLQNHQIRMEKDTGVREWVTQDETEETLRMPSSAIHPQLKAEAEFDNMDKLWGGPPPTVAATMEFLAHIPEAGYEGAP